jgi:hypothetical protein
MQKADGNPNSLPAKFRNVILPSPPKTVSLAFNNLVIPLG